MPETLGPPLPEVIITQRVAKAQTGYAGERTPARAKLAFFGTGQVRVELIEPVDGPSTWDDHLDRHGQNLHHSAFQIQGMGEKVAPLGEQGVPLVQKGEFPGGRYACLDDASSLGTIIELLESD